MTNAPLRGCPLCGTKVSDIDLGLRDFAWVADALPGKIAPMDLDFVLERNGQALILEFKPKGAPLPLGQRITLRHFVTRGDDVWVVHEDGISVEVGAMNKQGVVQFTERMRVAQLKRRVVTWLKEASNER